MADKSWQTATGKQATKYFERYRLVLITNYREFRLIGEDENGNPLQREYFSLADDETGFWALTANASTFAKEQGAHFAEFLHRVMMNAAPLRKPEDIAWFLASYARDALATLGGKDATALAPLKSALETALGIKFEGQKGEHFFRSTLVQTLFYGVFSAWVIWARENTKGRFDWRSAGYILTVPMIRSLFEEMAKPSRLAPFGLMDVLDRTGEALNRVDRGEFFKSFDTGKAVQHFYEPFLEAFDPELRKQMGGWYTPPEIVRYMVARVDTVLRTELGIADGLADKNVFVLDPCCGTGAFLVEVLHKIEETLRAKGDDPLIGQGIKEAAQKRIFGFEIMSAPFVIAHWQVGNMLASPELNAPIDPTKGERPSIYLTNALTGWTPPEGIKATLPMFPELADERDQAEHVKRDVPILVVIGNPPYNAYAGTSPEEEDGLVDPYKDGLISKWGIKKFNLDDLYTRFFRIAQRRIADTGRGVVAYISNYSFTREPSFVVMREHLLKSFDKLWIENMHGDRNKSEYAPDGRTSETIFAIPGFSPGIRQGITISLAAKTGKPDETQIIRYRDDINAARAAERRQQLLDSLAAADFDGQYAVADPQPWNRLSFKPLVVSSEYLSWPKLDELAGSDPPNGLMEKRGGALIDIDRDALAERMGSYFNPDLDWPSYKLLGNSLTEDAARFDAEKTRKKALGATTFEDDRIVRYICRPFDVRHAYYSEIRPIWNEPRPELWPQYSGGNRFLMSRAIGQSDPEGIPICFTRCLADDHAMKTDAYLIAFARKQPAQGLLEETISANLAAASRSYLHGLGHANPDSDDAATSAIWLHALAIAHSPKYLSDNKDGIAIDWPRVPLPAKRAVLDASAQLGGAIAALLDTESEVDGVTVGTICAHLRPLGVVSATDLGVRAGWGSRDTKGRVNPGKGHTETRAWSPNELVALKSGFASIGIDEPDGLSRLGRAVDVYLNADTCWRAVPEAVWGFVIGGYQVIKKWLSYREESVLGRALTKDESREVTAMVRRLAALVMMGGELDENYNGSRAECYTWPT